METLLYFEGVCNFFNFFDVYLVISHTWYVVQTSNLQVNNYEIVVNFFHWYSAIVHKFPVCSNLWTAKTIQVNLCKKLRNQSQKE